VGHLRLQCALVCEAKYAWMDVLKTDAKGMPIADGQAPPPAAVDDEVSLSIG
jgi:hypothetical protein